MSIFLSAEEVIELTGIKKGRNGKSRDELQCEHLQSLHIPYFKNASGRPIVTKAAVEGGTQPSIKKQPWRSAVLTH
jgi:hypothetical protein